MKNLIFLIILLIPFICYSQADHMEYNKMPAIYYVDRVENAYKEKNINLIDFYDTWENNGTFSDNRLTELKRKLEEDVVSFISKGWLYVVSYEPNKNSSRNDNDYNNEPQRHAFLYKKFVGDSKVNNWIKACNRPIFTYNNPNNVSGAFSFTIKKDKDCKYNERIVKTNDDNIIFVLFDIQITFNGRSTYTKLPLILTSEINNNNMLCYNYQELHSVRLSDYIKKFKREEFDASKLNSNSFTLKTIDNNDKELSINMKSKTERTKDGFSETNISYTGNWGFSSFKESNYYIK